MSSNRKENIYIVDEKLKVCKIITSLSKKLNKDIDLWNADKESIETHEYDVIIDNDKGLIKLLKDNYLVFYDNANDIRRQNTQNPNISPYEKVGYFWCWNIHSKRRIPLGRLVWQYKHKREIPDGLVVDHGNDMRNLSIITNLSLLTQSQNKAKLRYPKRIVEPYSITLISHPKQIYTKLLRFKDDSIGEQELLIYDIENGVQPLLDDLNSFKLVSNTDASMFKHCFENLKDNSENYIAHTKQSTTGDLFMDELFHYSVDWKEINKLVKSFWSEKNEYKKIV